MGLSASQARLLTITARKADCEFQSMQLSHQKIALSRDMENISTEYQQALNQSKLVYDYYGTGTSQMDLTYDLLMKPSIYNDYYPKLITDSQNRVVLDDRYAAAAIYAGIPAEGLNGTSSSEVRDAFIRALAGEGDDGNKVVDKNGKPLDIINETTKDIIINTTYNNSYGLGASVSATESTQNVTYTELLEKIEAMTLSTEDYGMEEFGGRVTSDVWGDAVQFLNKNRESKEERANGNYYSNNSTFVFKGKKDEPMTNMTNGTGYSLTLAELLKDEYQYTYAIQVGGGQCHPGGDAAFLQQVIVGGEYDKSFLNWMTDQFSTILGGVTQNDLALQYAYNNVYDLVYPNEDIQELGEQYIKAGVADMSRSNGSDYSKHHRNGYDKLFYIGTNVANCYDDDRIQTVTDKADEYIGCTFSACYHSDSGNQSTIAINLNNLAKIFLTSYVEYLQGIDTSTYNYNLGKIENANLYNAKDSDIFTIKGNSSISGNESLLASYYDTLFNLICVNGWTENDEIGTNKAYLQELMKNGSVFISSINNDGYYYMGNYSTDVYIAEISDTEAIAKAEAKYNSEKAKIENKENTIDMKMKNLDTEISSLTTEYDTTKSIITKAIEKSFKRYEA